MGTEIEKKYRLSEREAERLRRRLVAVGALARGAEFEENTLYAGHGLEQRDRVLRLRRVEGRAMLTYKERRASNSAIKRRREDETEVKDADALAAILDALGYRPALVYEKRRETWHIAGAEITIDQLPFGWYAEIEGDENTIIKAERLLELDAAEAEHASYPQLTCDLGIPKGEMIEARFQEK